MPFFLRTRRLDIKRLERKPQKSLSVVHAVLSAALRDILTKLGHIEVSFYGADSADPIRTVRGWAVCVKAVMADVRLAALTSSRQIDEIVKRTTEAPDLFKVDVYHLNGLKEVNRKVTGAVPDAFADVLVETRTVLKYLDKYCLSFYDVDGDIVYNTADHYDRERTRYADTIRANVDNVARMAQRYATGSLHTSDLSSAGQEFARKADCLTAAFLAMFHEACWNIRAACSAASAWVDADACYADFVRNDIGEMRARRAGLLRDARESADRYHQAEFRLKLATRHAERLATEVERLRAKNSDLLVEERILADEIRSVQLEIVNREHRRDELIRTAIRIEPRLLYELYGQLSEEIRERKARLPAAGRRLAGVRYRRAWIGRQEGALGRRRAERASREREAGEAEGRRDASARLWEEAGRRLGVAQQVYLYKASGDTMAKIFNDQTVGLNYDRLPGRGDASAPFDTACAAVAEHIEHDWPRLYRRLPFHPPRGTSTIDDDVSKLSARGAHGNLADLVACGLRKWRRYHTRAKLDDLKETLATIQRADILRVVEQRLLPPVSPHQRIGVATDQTDVTDADTYFQSLLKEVERFDQLRAANKI